MYGSLQIETTGTLGRITLDGKEVKNVTGYALYHEAGERPNVGISVACSLGSLQFDEAEISFNTNLDELSGETLLSLYEVCKIELEKRGLL